MKKPPETTNDLAVLLSEAHDDILDVMTILKTLVDANPEENSGHMAEITLKQTQDISGTIETSFRKLEGFS